MTTTYRRNFLKFLEIISYTGGIFTSLFALFFFVQYFSMYFFELAFAHQYFKIKEAKNTNFRSYVKFLIFKIVKKVGLPINTWKESEKQQKLREIVNNILDINCLLKRV